jgi:CRP/FNR family putative post-exponential-phase nitrogen-starvation transcriptional regulator
METMNDRALMQRYMKDLHITECFGRELPRFLLLHYNPGDLLTTPFSPSKYLQFVAEGDLLLYDMPDESQIVMLQTNSNAVKLIGEVELLNPGFDPFFVEAASHVYTLAIYLDTYRDLLLNDPVFLRYICVTLSDKLAGAVHSTMPEPLKTRVIRSLRYAEPGDRFGDIAGFSARLGVSSRQLLRVLKALCEEGILKHEKKGQYQLLKKL